MVDQTDAAGNTLKYAQNGTWADGTPRYSATQNLGAAGQALQATNQGTQQNLSSLAQEQSGRLSGLLASPLDWSQQQQYLEGLTTGALDKTWDRDAQRFETDLVNRGFRPGTTAYNDQLGQFSDRKSSAYNAANVGNYNTALQSQMALRQQPISEILALAGQSQLQSPQFANSPQTGVAGTDVSGIMASNYQQQNQQYQNQQSQLGGLFSAGANLLPLAFSDIRLKRDIERVGELPSGLPVYDFKYVWSDEVQTGVMAQDVRVFFPEAVYPHESGYLMVDYGRIG